MDRPSGDIAEIAQKALDALVKREDSDGPRISAIIGLLERLTQGDRVGAQMAVVNDGEYERLIQMAERMESAEKAKVGTGKNNDFTFSNHLTDLVHELSRQGRVGENVGQRNR